MMMAFPRKVTFSPIIALTLILKDWVLSMAEVSTLHLDGPVGGRGKPGCMNNGLVCMHAHSSGCTSGGPMCTCMNMHLNLCKLSCAHVCTCGNLPLVQVKLSSHRPVANRPWPCSGLLPRDWGPLSYGMLKVLHVIVPTNETDQRALHDCLF